TLGSALLCGTLALTLSVWGTKTHEVLLITYLFETMILLILPNWSLLSRSGWLGGMPAWVEWTNPFWVAFLPNLRPGAGSLREAWIFLGITGGLPAALAVLAVVRLRAVVLRQASRPPGVKRPRIVSRLVRARPGLPGPSLDSNPVFWREWHCRRPSR